MIYLLYKYFEIEKKALVCGWNEKKVDVQNNKKYLDVEMKSAYTGEIILESGIFMKYME